MPAVPRPGFAGRLLSSLLQMDRLHRVYSEIRATLPSLSFVDQALAALRINYRIVHGSLESVPQTGPLVIVANHPFGGIEGLALMSMLDRVRPDVRVMATQVLGQIEELRPRLCLVDLLGGADAAAHNAGSVRKCLRWLKQGGALVVFPAGEVAHLNLAERAVRESPWMDTVAGLVRRSGASVLPVFFEGFNGPLFQIAGVLHPRLRTALLAREIVNKEGSELRVRVGSVIPFGRLEKFDGDREMTRYLRLRVLLLGARGRNNTPRLRRALSLRHPVPIITAEPADVLAAEISRLPESSQLVESGDYEVHVAGAGEIPSVMREIARLREITFRAVGEGTLQACDRDAFDFIYLHLFVWNRRTREVVGAYRLGLTDKILSRHGLCGLYTSTLFNFSWELIQSLDPAIEIGRSFVRQEYQRRHLPLLLLWKGIGRFVARHPKYRRLFGTVSISNTYEEASRHLVAGYFEQQKPHELARHSVCPRNPLRGGVHPVRDRQGLACHIPDFETLSEMISDIESDGKGVPVLLRQYIKMGGQVLACNVDPKFNMALDALLVVDLPRTDPRLLELYMGDLMPAYLASHGECGEQVSSRREMVARAEVGSLRRRATTGVADEGKERMGV